LEFSTAFLILGADIADDRAHTVYVIGHHYTAESLNENKTDGLLMIACSYVSESNSKHDVCGPIIRPNVLNFPSLSVDSSGSHPIFLRT